MELRKVFKQIEGSEFQSRYMLFSGFKLVRNALARESNITSLINEIRLNPGIVDAVGKRILHLFAEHRDSPGAAYDIAVAAYLFCLYKTDQFFAKRMSEYILARGKLWWSTDLALLVKRNMDQFGDPRKTYVSNFGDATQVASKTWNTQFEPTRLNEHAPFVVNGEERWNTFGQFSAKSLQKTETLMHSV